MTVTNTNSSVSYAGDDVTTDFPTTFRFLDDSHLTVILTDADDVEATLVLGTHYNVSGAGDDEPGGTVEMLIPPASDETLTIERNTPITQETGFGTFTTFSPATHEEMADKLTMIAQEERRRSDELAAGAVTTTLTNTVVTKDFTASEPIEDTFPFTVITANRPAYVLLARVENLTDSESLPTEGLRWGTPLSASFVVDFVEGLEPGKDYRLTFLVLSS